MIADHLSPDGNTGPSEASPPAASRLRRRSAESELGSEKQALIP